MRGERWKREIRDQGEREMEGRDDKRWGRERKRNRGQR